MTSTTKSQALACSGTDAGVILTQDGRQRVATLLMKQPNETNPGLLANEMNKNEPDRAIALLRAVHQGLLRNTTNSLILKD